eukprot:365980-Chlamydomonas_euryale.AAC.5
MQNLVCQLLWESGSQANPSGSLAIKPTPQSLAVNQLPPRSWQSSQTLRESGSQAKPSENLAVEPSSVRVWQSIQPLCEPGS